jgi:acetolactate synthase-1/2/3 large subunit
MLAAGNALPNAGRIAAALGAALLCDPLPGRITRGAGLPHCTRLPYFPQEASAELAKFDVVLLLDIKRPVATFGYKWVAVTAPC